MTIEVLAKPTSVKFREACIRCPMLHPDPLQEPRLLVIIANLE